MTRREIIQLLAFIAAYDQRTNGEADVTAWSAVANHARWGSLLWAQRAVIEYYATKTDRIMPAHITNTIQSRREVYASTYRHQEAPENLSQGEEVAWEKEQLSAHISECMDRWAQGERGAA